jgi:hypothetical protein
LTDIRASFNLPESSFRIKFPPGTIITDKIRGTSHKVMPDGVTTKSLGHFTEVNDLEPSGTASPTDLEETRWSLAKPIFINLQP